MPCYQYPVCCHCGQRPCVCCISAANKTCCEVFGGRFHTAAYLVALAPGGSEVVPLPGLMAAKNVDMNNQNTIRITATGSYQIHYQVAFLPDAAGLTGAAVRQNGQEIAQLTNYYAAAAQQQAIITGSTFLSLAGPGEFDLVLKNAADTQLNLALNAPANGVNAFLMIRKLAEL